MRRAFVPRHHPRSLDRRLPRGTWAILAKALRLKDSTLVNIANEHKPVSATLAVRIAKFSRVGVDDVLTGKFPSPGTCPHCGNVVPTDEVAPPRPPSTLA
jgi:hypothetical protein